MNKNLTLILPVIFLLFSHNPNLHSQKTDSCFIYKNIVYVDFATIGAFYSINYDRIFSQKDKLTWCYRLGISVMDDVIAFPLGINTFTGKKTSHAEFGLNLMPYVEQYKSLLKQSDDSDDTFLYIIPSIGYRLHSPIRRFFFKTALSPSIRLDPPSGDFWHMDPKFYFIGDFALGVCF